MLTRTRLIVALGLVAVATTAVAIAAPPPREVNASGIGPVRIGSTYAALKTAGLVGRLTPGCPLGPKRYGARLLPPGKGAVTFNATRHVVDVSATARAETAKGITLGDTATHVLATYPGAHYDRAKRSDPIPFGVIQVKRNGRPQFSFLINARSNRVVEIDVPGVQFCE